MKFLRSKKLVFCNHKGGVGKTTLAYNTAVKFAKHGYKTVLVDFDPQCNVSELALGNIIVEVERSWIEKDDVIYFYIASKGMSGQDWIAHFQSKGYNIPYYAQQILMSNDFKVSPADTIHHIAVLKGGTFIDSGCGCVTKKIRARAKEMKFSKPNAEIVCLIRDQFSNDDLKAMGLWWIVCMHKPIKDSNGVPSLLGVSHDHDSWLCAYLDHPEDEWGGQHDFAFSVLQS